MSLVHEECDLADSGLRGNTFKSYQEAISLSIIRSECRYKECDLATTSESYRDSSLDITT